jgi:hypothetical protein
MSRLKTWLTAALLAGPAISEPLACPGPGPTITVTAGTTDHAVHLCSVARAARSRLAACHMPQTAPIDIRIVTELPAQHAKCMGLYHCDTEIIEILDLAGLRRSVSPSSAFARIPPEALQDSLVAHEMVHALIHQRLGADSGPPVQNEYIAYAMQLDLMSDPARQALLAARDIKAPIPPEGLNEIILLMAPDVFAIFSWHHFRQEGHGCTLIGKLLDGAPGPFPNISP